MKTKLKQIEKIFRPARLVWDAGSAEAPKTAEKLKDNLEFKENEKWDQKKMDEVADRIKSLNLSGSPLGIKLNMGEKSVNAVNFKQSLDEALKSMESTLKVTNLSSYLLDGLMKRLGIGVDNKIGENYAEKRGLTKWLADKKILSFNIVDGQWVFYSDKEGKIAVTADCVIDQPAQDKPVDPKVPKPKVEKQSLTQFDVTKEVTKAKDNDRTKKEKDVKDAQAEVERLKPENLEKVNSDVPVDLKKDLTLADFCLNMQLFSTPENTPIPIQSAEIRAQILKYIAVDPSLKGDSEEKTFSNFMTRLDKDGFRQAKIVNGKICFSKDGKIFDDSNPLGASKTVNGAQEKAVIYAHEKLESRATEKAKEAKAKADKATEVKPTKYDGVEQETAKLLTGKDKLEKGDLDKVDARYLDAMKAILDYKDGRPATEFNLMINDVPLKCKFQKVDGKYEIRWGEGNRYYIYNPKLNAESPLKDAQKFYAEALNSGRVLRELQLINVKDKANFEKRDLVVDSGPKVGKDGVVKYEFDWATGISKDPDVEIKVGLHGELGVHVDVGGIGLNGEDTYDFKASSFQDMVRTLKTLQKYVEASDEEKDKMRQNESERRFFDKGKEGLQSEASGIDCGKILRVMSVGSTVESKMSQGYYLDMDWMQKLEPAQKVQIVNDGAYNLVTVAPRGLILGRVTREMPGGFRDAMRLVAESKGNMTLKGGPRLMRDKTEALVKLYNERDKGYKPDPYRDAPKPIKSGKCTFGAGVEVISYTDGNVMLSRDGMASKSFQLGQKNEKGEITFNAGEFAHALKQGYLIVDNPNFADDKAPKKPGNLKEDKDFSVEKTEKTQEIVDKGLKIKSVDDLLRKHSIVEPSLMRVHNYVKLRMMRVDAPNTTPPTDKNTFYENQAWKYMAQLVKEGNLVKNFTPEDPLSEDNKKVVVEALKVPKFREAFDQQTLELLQGKFKNMPKLRTYLKAVLDRVTYNPQGTEDTDKAMLLYKTKIIALAEGLITNNPIDKKTQTIQAYDVAIVNLFKNKYKEPEVFVQEYKPNAQATRDYEKARQDFATGKAANDQIKKSPHAKTFEEWDKEGRVGVGTKAWEILNKTTVVEKKNIWLSRIDYGAQANDRISFNVRYGQAPNERPMTLHFRIDSKGALMVSASEGWNNKEVFIEPIKPKDGADPVKEALDYLAGITKLSYAKSGDEKPVGSQADQPITPAPATPASKPDAPAPSTPATPAPAPTPAPKPAPSTPAPAPKSADQPQPGQPKTSPGTSGGGGGDKAPKPAPAPTPTAQPQPSPGTGGG